MNSAHFSQLTNGIYRKRFVFPSNRKQPIRALFIGRFQQLLQQKLGKSDVPCKNSANYNPPFFPQFAISLPKVCNQKLQLLRVLLVHLAELLREIRY